MIFKDEFPKQTALREAITAAYQADETEAVQALLAQAQMSPEAVARVQQRSTQLIEKVRKARMGGSGLDSFLYEYDLSSDEGITLMCLAEALLRIPDKFTIDRLIRDKVSAADWTSHLGQGDSMAVNAATWALMLTGKILNSDEAEKKSLSVKGIFKKLLGRTSEPVVRGAIGQAMKILSRQFILGRTIDEALKRAKVSEKKGYRYSYDMLGEAARTSEDAARYFEAYQTAIESIGASANGAGVINGPGISIKLSALHPRYEFSQREKVLHELVPKVFALAQQASIVDIALTIDAEEADRLDLSLDIIEAVFSDPALDGWDGFGLALQAYQKRAPAVIDWLIDFGKRAKRCIKVRLVKGAYWDSEIKHAQMMGFPDYPVYTRKPSTDVSYLACAKKLIAAQEWIYPQFATHNAYSVAAILELMGDRDDFEFQCLHGMGHTLYDQVVGKENLDLPCRIYAPVGSHEDLLAYLVRRLLENGANTSFVNRIVDANAPVAELVTDPIAKVEAFADKPHPKIPLPEDVFGHVRKNSAGIDLTNWQALQTLSTAMQHAEQQNWSVAPIINGHEHIEEGLAVTSPYDHSIEVGKVQNANDEHVEQALQHADAAFTRWSQTDVELRANYLEAAADLFEKHHAELMTLAVREAGKTLADAVAEVREAVDFCRYYAATARDLLAEPTILHGYTGESDQLSLHGRGTILCISPWNFPLAIFTGQVVAALVTGNCVVAKPAEQTPLIAGLAIRLLHTAGIPADVLQLLPGTGETVGAKCVADCRIKGVMFTGSTETARLINQSLATRGGPIVPLIAETGGQNAMIVDSSALPEQVVEDTVTSAFGSAGQRCSAMRVLFVQEDIADKLITMLRGAMAELTLGDPSLLATDVGPVIDQEAQTNLQKHIDRMHSEAKLIYQLECPAHCQTGTFIAPVAFELASLELLEREVFGPVLHVLRFASKDLDKVINSINNTGYGLTLGIHSRISETIEKIKRNVRVGNCYINRNMIGAVVGLQPFGGEGLSGTGPKAGGPHYLARLCTERVVSVDTTAVGGNASLVSLGDG